MDKHKLLLLIGLGLNIALMLHVYFIVDGGPASTQHNGDWMEFLNEVPMTLLLFLAAVFKPYLMIWSKCRNNAPILMLAGGVMLAITALACVIDMFATQAVTRDLTLYVNWALLWGASYYFVLVPQRPTAR